MNIIVLPEHFKHQRYGGLWLDTRCRWADQDLVILSAACDLGIDYTQAANRLGRAPTSLISKAFDKGIKVPQAWRSLVYRAKKPLLNLSYPFIVKPTDENADLLAVNRMVSRAMPGREDVCQDIMLALLESRISLAELRADPKALKAFMRSFRKSSFERAGYGVESMDVTIHSDSGDGKSKYEDARYQQDLADSPATFWSRLEMQ